MAFSLCRLCQTTSSAQKGSLKMGKANFSNAKTTPNPFSGCLNVAKQTKQVSVKPNE